MTAFFKHVKENPLLSFKLKKACVLFVSMLTTAMFSLPQQSSAATLNGISLETNVTKALAQEELESRLSKFYGQEITASLLEDVLAQVSKYYQEIGYPLSEAYLPEQKIINGVLNVYVHDPKIQEIIIDNKSYLNSYAENLLLNPLKDFEDESINSSEIESQLLKLSDIGVFNVRGTYSTNQVDPNLLVNVEDKGMLAFNAFTDNHGTKASGEYRFGGQVKLRNLLGFADTFSLFYARSSEKQNNYALNYEMPISKAPTMLGVSLCLSDYELGREYEALGAQGEYQSYEMYLRHPIHRTLTERVDFNAGLRYRDLTDEFKEFDVRFSKETYAAYAGLTGAFLFENNVLLGAYSTFTAGKLNNKEDDFDFYEDGFYGLMNFGASVDIPLVKTLTLNFALDGQMSTDDVDSSEHFVASGAHGVSAYDSSVAQGDQGVRLTAALEYAPIDNFDFKIRPHLDFACVQDKDLKTTDSISGIGLALSAEYQGLYAKLDLSHAIGSKPQGDFDEGQIFFSVGYNFD